MQMKDYPRVRNYDPSDIILIDKPTGGTKSLTLGDLVSGDNNPTFQAISDAEEQLSTKRHAVGDLFIYDNKLCKAIAEIAVGNELVFGGNIEATTISDEIASINADLANNMRFIFNAIVVGTDGSTVNAITTTEQTFSVTPSFVEPLKRGILQPFTVKFGGGDQGYELFLGRFPGVNPATSRTYGLRLSHAGGYITFRLSSDYTKLHVVSDQTSKKTDFVFRGLFSFRPIIL